MLVVATPVFRGSYTGLFKHFFDFVHQDALIDKPVLLAATGGSERHALVIDHQLRPLFSFFQARTLPLGIYATDKDFVDYRLQDDALIGAGRAGGPTSLAAGRIDAPGQDLAGRADGRGLKLHAAFSATLSHWI